MKDWLKQVLVFLAVFLFGFIMCIIIYTCNNQMNKPTPIDIKMDSINHKIDSIASIRDSISTVNETITNKIFEVHRTYEKKVDVIRNQSLDSDRIFFTRYINNYHPDSIKDY